MIYFWESKLCNDALLRPSLIYFDPRYSNLTKPHPIITTPAGNPYEVNKCVIQLRMLSGRYPDDWLTRHWSENKSGDCVLCLDTMGDLGHFLSSCKTLEGLRLSLFQWWLSFDPLNVPLTELLDSRIKSDRFSFVRFVLDPSADKDSISLMQQDETTIDSLFKLTRTYCFSLHKRRRQLLSDISNQNLGS